MIVHLSISSSNDRLPKGGWVGVWVGILIFIVTILGFIEWHIRSLGWSPSVVDSSQLWAKQRMRASQLGDDAIILVGASRMQLDVDLDIVKNQSGLIPVQLAIDGAPFIPVLENLANDPNITGTVLMSVISTNLGRGKITDISTQWVNEYQQVQRKGLEPYRVLHDKVSSFLSNRLVLRLEGAKLYTIITKLGFRLPSEGNYLVTYTDRSRDADYGKVQMPSFYAVPVARRFGKLLVENGATADHFFKTYIKAIQEIKASHDKNFNKKLKYLLTLVKKIEARGGNVIFIRFPTGGLVWEIDKKLHPRELYWKEIKSQHAASIHFSDYPELSSFTLPDGSHLDYRDKKKFTAELMNILDDEKLL